MTLWQHKGSGGHFIRPKDNLGRLDEQLNGTGVSLVIDMTGGNIANRLESINGIPQWNELHFSRVRRTDDGSLATTGHMVSHTPEQVHAALKKEDASNILLLDDTSFSGATNELAETFIRRALPEKAIAFQHGFLIANEGELAPDVPGAIQRLGNVAAGHVMRTPNDDGWHIFDIVQQPRFSEHLSILQKALHDRSLEPGLFVDGISGEELKCRQQDGTFIASGEIEGEQHRRNPQLLPRIIAAGHIEPVKRWHNEDEVFDILFQIGAILDKEGKS